MKIVRVEAIEEVLSPSVMVVPEVHSGILQRLMEVSMSLCLAKRVLKLQQIRLQVPATSLYSIPKGASREAWTDRGNSTRTLPHFLLLFKVFHCLLKVHMPVCLICTGWCCAVNLKRVILYHIVLGSAIRQISLVCFLVLQHSLKHVLCKKRFQLGILCLIYCQSRFVDLCLWFNVI